MPIRSGIREKLSGRASSSESVREAYLNRSTRVSGFPRIVFVELSQHCNLACDMCRPEGNLYARNRMSDEIFNLTARQLFPTAEWVDLRGWGESLILPGFPERVRVVRDHGAELRIVTNFSFRADSAIEALAEANAHVSVSLDSPDPETLAEVRKGAKLSLIVENIRKLAKAYARHGNDFDRVYIGATIQERSVDGLPGLVALAAELGIHDVRLFPRQNEGTQFPLSSTAKRSLLERVAEIGERARAVDVKIRFGAKLWPEMLDHKPPYDFPCLRPWSYCFVGWNGDLGYCDFLMGPGWEKHAIANISDRDFAQTWNGSRWRELRERHRCGNTDGWSVSSACSWCYRNRYVDFEDEFESGYRDRVLTPDDVLSANR